MHPLLFEIGPLPVIGKLAFHTYGALIALGFFVGVYVTQRLGKSYKMDGEKLIDLGFYVLLVGLLGARLLYVITRWEYFSRAPGDIVKIWEGGLVFYGGLIAAVPFAIWFLRKYRFNLWQCMDVVFPGLATAHLFGRLGCFASGCCHGKPTDGALGVLFPHLDHPVHATQLYEAVSLGLLVGLMLWIFPRRKFEGQVGLIYLMGYPVIRFIVEIFRGDDIRGFVIEGLISTSQFISIIAIIIAAYVMKLRFTKASG